MSFTEKIAKLTDWKNEPTVSDLKTDFINCKPAHDNQMGIIDKYIRYLKAEPLKVKGRSSVQPKLIRKQAEWRYAALSEPFLSTDELFSVRPVTFEDSYGATQNELVLNYQFNTYVNKIKLIDDYVRACVDVGTAIFRVDWLEYTEIKDMPEVQYQMQPIDPKDKETLARFERITLALQDNIKSSIVPDQWKQCVERAQEESDQRAQQLQQQIMQQAQQQLQQIQMQAQQMQQMGQEVPEELQAQMQQIQQEAQQQFEEQLQQLPPIAYLPVETGTRYIKQEKVINRPSVKLCRPFDVYVDSTCEGDVERAEFIINRFDSCKADLLKNPKYKNVELIPESTTVDYDEWYVSDTEALKDPARKKLTVYEYWGNWDINGDGTKVPIVATWVNGIMLRLEENPYPDHKPPFVFVNYLPVANSIYGEPDGALIAENQDIIGAVTRGIIDLLGKSANSQTGTAISFLDPINKKAFTEGRDYEFNPTMPPQQAIFQHTYPEIPQTVMPFLQALEFEAEALTGVKGFSQGINGDTLGQSATGARGVLDATSKREMGILRRLADGLKQVARKIIAMNALWLNDEEVIRITNQDFVTVRRDDLAGNYDLALDISSPEDDNARSESLAFMLQTLGNNVDQELTKLILSEICRLKKMPELAEKIKRQPPPEPSPQEQQMMQMQMQLMQAQIQKLSAEIQKLGADAQYSQARAQSEMVEAQIKPQQIMSQMQSDMAKAKYNESLTKKLDLDYYNEIDGTTHNRNLEVMSQQAQAQADKSAKEKYMDFNLLQEKYRLEKELQEIKNQGKTKN